MQQCVQIPKNVQNVYEFLIYSDTLLYKVISKSSVLYLFKKGQCTLINTTTKVHRVNIPHLAIWANFHL